MTSAVNQIIEVGFDNGWQYNFAITCTLYNFWIYRNLVIISTFLQKHNVASELWTCTLCFLWCGQTSPMLFKLGFPTTSPPCRPALHGGATPGLIPRRSKKVVSFDSVNLPSGKCCWKVWSDRNKRLNFSKQIGSNIFPAAENNHHVAVVDLSFSWARTSG